MGRRTYEEIAGTKAYAIIKSAGLQPWPDLTPTQLAMLDARAREEADFRRQLGGLPSGGVLR